MIRKKIFQKCLLLIFMTDQTMNHLSMKCSDKHTINYEPSPLTGLASFKGQYFLGSFLLHHLDVYV